MNAEFVKSQLVDYNAKIWHPDLDRPYFRVYVKIPPLPKLEYSNIYARIKIWYDSRRGIVTGSNWYELKPENRKKIEAYCLHLEAILGIVRDDPWAE